MRWRCRDERGSMSVEIIFMVPILFMFTLFLVAGGRYVTVKSDIESAARDAARAASLERSADAAADSARAVARSSLGRFSDCVVEGLGGDFRAGGRVDVTLNCQVSNVGLGFIGLGGSQRMSATGSAPLDTYRRTG